MEIYESRLTPGTFITLDWTFRLAWVIMYRFTCADGSVGAMDERSFHEFYKLVDKS